MPRTVVMIDIQEASLPLPDWFIRATLTLLRGWFGEHPSITISVKEFSQHKVK